MVRRKCGEGTEVWREPQRGLEILYHGEVWKGAEGSWLSLAASNHT